MYVDIPDLTHMEEQKRAEETERALKELVARINRLQEEMERKVEELRKHYGL